jgi:Tfp pilus assembly protein PilO
MSAGWTGRQWLAVAGLVLVNVLAFLFLVRPAWEAGNQREGQVLDFQRRIRAVQREGQSSEAILTAFREVEEFTRGYPQRSELVALIGRMTDVAKKNGLDTPAVDYRPSEIKEAGLTKVALSLGVEGPYPNIRRYLYELEGMRRQVVIERVTLRDPRGSADLQVQLLLALYVR